MSESDVRQALRVNHDQLHELHQSAGLPQPDMLGRYKAADVKSWIDAQCNGGSGASADDADRKLAQALAGYLSV